MCVVCSTVVPSAVRASSECTPSRVNTALTQKAQDGRAVCAASPPNEAVTADSAIWMCGGVSGARIVQRRRQLPPRRWTLWTLPRSAYHLTSSTELPLYQGLMILLILSMPKRSSRWLSDEADGLAPSKPGFNPLVPIWLVPIWVTCGDRKGIRPKLLTCASKRPTYLASTSDL